MLRFTRGKVIAIVAVILFGCLLAVPNLLSGERREAIRQAVPTWAPSWLVPTRAIVLGLDLQGGSHVLLEVDVPDLLRTQAVQLRDDVRRALRETGVGLEGGIQMQPRGVQLRVSDAAGRARLMPKLRELSQPISNPILGQTGASTLAITEAPDGLIQLVFTEQGVTERVRRAIEQVIEVLRRRVDAVGTTEPNIQRQGADRVLVQVPGLQDPQRLKELLGRTAKLEFRMLAQPGATDVDLLPSRDNEGQRVPVERRVIVEGGDLTDAQPGFDQRTNEPIVNFRFNLRGAQRFGQTTTENVGRALAIVLDNEVISAPRILQPITGGSGQISGRFTVQQANDLAVLLRAGALPAKLTIVEERTVGPGLGQDFDPGRRHRLDRRHAGHGRLHGGGLRLLRRPGDGRADRQRGAHPRPHVGARRDADPARHRRSRPHHRHGRRFQRAHLRARARGAAPRPLGGVFARCRASRARSPPSSTPT